MDLDYIKRILSQASFHEWYGGCWKKYGAHDMDVYPIEDAYMYAKTGKPTWERTSLNLAEFKKVCDVV